MARRRSADSDKNKGKIMRITKSLLWLIRAILIILTLILIFQRDFLFAFSALIATLISFAPVFVERNYNIDFPWIIEFLIAFTLLLHILGEFFKLYTLIIFFSPLMHFFGTATIALLAFIIVYTLNLTKHVKLSPFMIGLFTLIFALAIGTLWEIGEFASDRFFGTHNQGDGRNPLVDTMLDLISDGITGLVVALLGITTNLIKNKKLIKPFRELVQKIFKKNKKQKPDKIKKAKKRLK